MNPCHCGYVCLPRCLEFPTYSKRPSTYGALPTRFNDLGNRWELFPDTLMVEFTRWRVVSRESDGGGAVKYRRRERLMEAFGCLAVLAGVAVWALLLWALLA